MATHSRILAWRIPWTKEPGRLQSVELDTTEHTHTHTHTQYLEKKSHKQIKTPLFRVSHSHCDITEDLQSPHSDTLDWGWG